MRRDRDSYAEVGRAMRASIERVLEHGTLTRQMRVYLACQHLLTSYSRLTDRVFVQQVAAIAGIPGDVRQRHTRRHLRELDDMLAIAWDPVRGGASRSRLSLLAEGRPQPRPLVAVVSDEPRPDVVHNPGQLELLTPATGGRPTEKVREDSSEGNEICGFCCRRRVTVTVSVDGGTGACDTCAESIERHSRSALQERAVVQVVARARAM